MVYDQLSTDASVRGPNSPNFHSELLLELLFAISSLYCVRRCPLNLRPTDSRTFREVRASKSVSRPKNLKIHLESLKALQEACKKPSKYLKQTLADRKTCARITSQTGGLREHGSHNVWRWFVFSSLTNTSVPELFVR